MTIADQITRLNNAKAAIKNSIENKGVTVSSTAKLDEYAALIDNIEIGSGGSDSEYVNPGFYELRTSGGTNYESLFYNYSGESLDFVANWDASKCTNMKETFRSCYNVVNLNLSGLNTGKVKSFVSLFNTCSKLETANLSDWNTSNVTDMSNMFYSNRVLKSLDLTGWDTSKCANMNYMFYNCVKLKVIIGELDISSLSQGLCNSSYTQVFKGCSILETVYLKNIYKNVTLTNASKWSLNLADTKVKDECLIYIINELPDLINDKGLTATDKIVLTLPPTNTLTAEQVQVAIDKGWQVANVTSTASTFSLRRRMVYKAVECEMGCYIASDGSRYEIFEAINVMTPQGENVGWDVFSNIEEAAEYYGLTYVEPDEE